jgi:lantibiotic modifying enzyme
MNQGSFGGVSRAPGRERLRATQGRASSIALHVAAAIETPAMFADHARRYAATDPFKRGAARPWSPLGLSHGLTGGLLFLAMLAQSTGDAGTAAEYRDALLRLPDPALTLFDGWYGTLAVLECAETVMREPRLIRDMRAQLAAAFLGEWSDAARDGAEYDIVNGYAGAMIALRHSVDARFDGVFDSVADGLGSPSLEPWCRPSRYTGGRRAVNLGQSHGVPGLVSGMALAAPGRYFDAKLAAARYIMHCADVRDGITYWPLERAAGGEIEKNRRHAWCFGTPGVTCALLRVAGDIGSAEVRDAALQAFESVGAAPISAWQLADCSICHGVSGVLLCALFIAKRTGSEAAWNLAADCAEAVCDAFDPGRPLGFAPDHVMSVETDVGFLQGVSGIALALLTGAGLADDGWTAVLGLGA